MNAMEDKLLTEIEKSLQDNKLNESKKHSDFVVERKTKEDLVSLGDLKEQTKTKKMYSSSLIMNGAVEANVSGNHENDEESAINPELLSTPGVGFESVIHRVQSYDETCELLSLNVDQPGLVTLDDTIKSKIESNKASWPLSLEIKGINHSNTSNSARSQSGTYTNTTTSHALVDQPLIVDTPGLNRYLDGLPYAGTDLLDNLFFNPTSSYNNSGPLVAFSSDTRDTQAATSLVLTVGDPNRSVGDLIDFEGNDVQNNEALIEPLLDQNNNFDNRTHHQGLFSYWNTDYVRKYYHGIFAFITRRKRSFHNNDEHGDAGHPDTSQHEVAVIDGPNDSTPQRSRRQRERPGNDPRRVRSTGRSSTLSTLSSSKSVCCSLLLFSIICFVLGALVRHEIQCTGSFKKKNKTIYPQVQRLQSILSCAAHLSLRTVNQLQDPTTPQGSAVYWFLIGAARLLPISQNDGSDYCNSDFAQLYSLIVFGNSVHVPYPKWYPNQTLNSFADVCHWPSVLCSGDKKYITNLTLGNHNLTGTVPDEVWNGYGMNRLQNLEINSNPELRGTIPSSISRLSDTLVSLKLSGTGIYGTIPSEIGQLTRLEELFLDETQITGTVPAAVCNLKKGSLRNLHVDIPCDCC